MFDKTINVKTIDLSGVNLPSDDEATCDLIYSALSTTYGFPIYMENFKVNGVKHDSVLVNPIILENQTIINLNDCHLIVTPTEISVGKGVYGASLESIVDKDGNHRFIEGDITMESVSGVTQTYGKWSLSGTHLMIVVSGVIVNGTSLTSDVKLAYITLPMWIFNKVPLLFADVVMRNSFTIYNDDWTSQGVTPKLIKANDRLLIESNAITATADRNFRFQFDILIDADYDE
jgi:hypothetical protein